MSIADDSPRSVPNLRQKPPRSSPRMVETASSLRILSKAALGTISTSPRVPEKPYRSHSTSTESIASSPSSSMSSSMSSDSDEEPLVTTAVATSAPQQRHPAVKVLNLPPPSPVTGEYQALLAERVRLDSELLSLWTNITTIAEEIVSCSEKAMPEEHSRALSIQKDQLLIATPQVINSIHETLTVTETLDSSRRSPSLNGDLSSRRSASGGHNGSSADAASSTTATKAIRTLDLVDSFRDDADLLSRHYLESLHARFIRKETQLQDVLRSNTALSQQLKKFSELAARRSDEVKLASERDCTFKTNILQALATLAAESFEMFKLHEEQNQQLDESILCSVQVNQQTASSVERGPFFLHFDISRIETARSALGGYTEFLQSTEPEAQRKERYSNKIATAYHPEAFPETLEQRRAEITSQRDNYEAEIHPFNTFVTDVFVEESQSRMRKSERRSVSPVATGRVPSGSASARSVSPYIPLPSTIVNVGVSYPAGSVALSAATPSNSGIVSRGRSPVHFEIPLETGRTSCGVPPSIASLTVRSSRSPSRKESVFRSNGMIHVPTSEAAVELLVVPSPATCLNARTRNGEMLPSLRTLLARREHLKKVLFEAQEKSKRELKVQLHLLEKDRKLADERQREEKRRREALVKSKVTLTTLPIAEAGRSLSVRSAQL